MAEGAKSPGRKRRSARQTGPQKKRCSIRREDLWELQQILDAKKASFEVWTLNRDTEKALDTLAILHERFGDLANTDKKFDKKLEKWRPPRKKPERPRKLWRSLRRKFMTLASNEQGLATSCDELEGALNEGRGCVHRLIAATAAATSALSIGTGVSCGEREQHC